jgi:hypothetical protein
VKSIPKSLWLLGLLAAGSAQALQIVSFSPQGEVARVRQAVAKFDAAAVPLATPRPRRRWPSVAAMRSHPRARAAGPASANGCSTSRPTCRPGMRCTATVKPEFKSASGALLTGAKAINSIAAARLCKRAARHLRADRRRAVLCAAAQRPGHAGQRAGQRVVRAGRRGRARAGAHDRRATSAPKCSRPWAWSKRARKEPLQFRWPATAASPRLAVQLVFGKGVATPSGVPNSGGKAL